MLLDKLRMHMADIAAHAQIAPRIGTVTIRHEDPEWFPRVGIDKPPMDEPGHQHGQPRKWVVAINSRTFAKLVAMEKRRTEDKVEDKRERFDAARVISEHGAWLRENSSVHANGVVSITANSKEDFTSRGIFTRPFPSGKKWRIQTKNQALRDFLRSKVSDFVPVPGTKLPPVSPLEIGYNFQIPFASGTTESPAEMLEALKTSGTTTNPSDIMKALPAPPAKQLVPRPEDFRTVIGDPVNHPAHYNRGGIECIDVIERLNLNYNLGNAMKYLFRADAKGNRREDLAKAAWYLNREIARMEATDGKRTA